jgi:hypothetical protein
MKSLRLILAMASLVVWGSSALGQSAASFTLPSGVAVRIVEGPFSPSEFKVQGCSDQGNCRINGRVPYGVAFGLPKTYVKSITVSFKDQTYSLDASQMYNAWGSRPLEHKGIIRYFGGKCFDAKNCSFRGLFSDAGGSFVAEWRIANGESMRTVLTESNDVVHLFMKNIDPPEYH